FRPRIQHRDVGDALVVDEPAEFEVYLAGRQLLGIEDRRAEGRLGAVGGNGLDGRGSRRPRIRLGQSARLGADLHLVHTQTSRSYGSCVSISWPMTARIATSSEASATSSGDS